MFSFALSFVFLSRGTRARVRGGRLLHVVASRPWAHAVTHTSTRPRLPSSAAIKGNERPCSR